MAFLVNDDTDSRVMYNDDTINENQMNTDHSSVTTEDEGIYTEFSRQASAYLSKARPFYDFKTKNRSFINLYKDLKQLGIKNNKFFLILYDKDLQGIDPHSTILPKDYQLKVFLECRVNPWYFLREVLRIPVDGMPIEPGGGTMYNIDRNDVATWYLFLNGIDHYKSKPRQRGKTQDSLAKFLYAYLFANLSSNMLFFNKDQDQANMNLYRLKCQRDMLPTYLQMRTVSLEDGKIDKGTENTKSIKNPVTGNIITTMGKATSKETAMKLGRGATAALQYMDEFDFMPWQTEIMNASAFAFSTAAENAIKHGNLAVRCLSSTPGDLDSASGASAAEFISHMLVWNDHMLDDPIEKIRETVNSPAFNRFIYCEHFWRQLKLPMSWYEKQCGLVSFNEEVIMREIDLKRIHGNSLSPFKRSDIMYLMSHIREPISQLDLSKNFSPFFIYERLKRGTPYMLCIDPAEGLGGDNTAVTLLNPYTQKVDMEFKSPYVSQPDLFEMLSQFMDRYCPKCMIIIESNRGRELINLFLNSRFKYQLYYDDNKITKEIVETVGKYGEAARRAGERRAYGLYTSSTNRHHFYAILETLVIERKDLLYTQFIVDDICGLVRKGAAGRVEAGAGKHDDNIMSYLFGMYLYYNLPPERLEEFGIIRGQSDTGTDYVTEDGDLTPQGKIRKIKEMLPSLPEEMRELFQEAFSTRSEVDDYNDAAREARIAQQIYQNNDPNRELDPNPAIHTPSNYEPDDNYWTQFDQGLINNNEDMFNRNSGFDPEDYI